MKINNLLESGRKHLELGQYEAAIQDLNEALRLDPKRAFGYESLGEAKRQLGQYEAAIQDCNEALRLDPQSAFAYERRGAAKLQLGQYEAAIQDCNEALRLDPKRAFAYQARGVTKQQLGQYEAAIGDFDEALRLDPQSDFAYQARGEAKQQLGQYEAAIQDFDEALRLDPQSAFAYERRGAAKLQLGQYEAAIQDFDEALRLDPKRAFAYQVRGAAKLQLGQYEAAIQDFDEALRLDPQRAFAYEHRGEAKRQLGQYEAAIQDLNEALRLDPKRAFAYQARGAAKRQLGQYEAAIEDFDEALRLDPQSAWAYERRGEAKRQLGQYEAAIQDYEEVLKLNPKNKIAQEALAVLKKQVASKETSVSAAFNNLTLVAKPSEPVRRVVSLKASYIIPSSAITLARDKDNQPIELGSGSFGTVYKGQWQYTEVAIKKLKIPRLTEKALAEFSQETKIMTKMTHPNVIRLYGACVEPNEYAMVMEYMPKGSLYNVLHSFTPPAWETRWKIALDIGKGIFHLHHKNILHRDLKSLNILLDAHNNAKVSDFGLSLARTETQTLTGSKNEAAGTLPWMAPELFNGDKYTKACDIYSFGIILWEMAACKNPYANFLAPFLIMNHVQQGKRETIPANTPPSYAKLIAKCWAQRAEQRPRIEEIVQELDEKQGEATLRVVA